MQVSEKSNASRVYPVTPSGPTKSALWLNKLQTAPGWPPTQRSKLPHPGHRLLWQTTPIRLPSQRGPQNAHEQKRRHPRQPLHPRPHRHQYHRSLAPPSASPTAPSSMPNCAWVATPWPSTKTWSTSMDSRLPTTASNVSAPSCATKNPNNSTAWPSHRVKKCKSTKEKVPPPV